MFGFPMFDHVPRSFKTQYRCYSVSMLPGQERQDVERGGKIIMPQSALDTLTRLNIVYPMMFKLTNQSMNRMTHCGVLEFVADEGKVYLPHWMMSNMLLEEGDIVHIESANLPVATYSKFQAQSVDFLDITNQKAVLENALRNFACLTTGDVVAINYNDKVYEMLVMETKPANAVSIIECDMNVEFAAPVGYVEPERVVTNPPPTEDTQDIPKDPFFKPFSGSGFRLDGKKKKKGQPTEDQSPQVIKRGIPNYDYQKGSLIFIRNSKRNNTNKDDDKIDPALFTAFSGKAEALRLKKSRKK